MCVYTRMYDCMCVCARMYVCMCAYVCIYVCMYVCMPSPFWGFLGLFRPENPETDWDDKPGKPRLVIPVRFGTFIARKGVG